MELCSRGSGRSRLNVIRVLALDPSVDACMNLKAPRNHDMSSFRSSFVIQPLFILLTMVNRLVVLQYPRAGCARM